MYDTRKCMIMFEGYESQEIVDFDDIKPYEVCNTDVFLILVF